MRRTVVALAVMLLVAAACGSDDADDAEPVAADQSAACLAGDPDCDDTGADIAAPPPSDAIDISDPEGPIAIAFGGFFYSDGVSSRLCDSLAESFPPQCGSTIIEIEGGFETVLGHVAESFGNPDDARINTEQGIWWTDEWVNISGILEDGRLVVS